MKKQIIFLILLTSIAISGKGQWTHHRTIHYEATGPSMFPSDYYFDGIGYASMDWCIYGRTVSSSGSQGRSTAVYAINEKNDSTFCVYYTSGYGVSGGTMVSEKKLGNVFRFGNWQGYPSTYVLDSTGNFAVIGIHPQGFTRCFSAFDINHLYSIFTNEFGAYIFYTRINEVGVKMDTFRTFAPQKIDFPAPDCGYMSIIEEGSGIHKILKSSPDLLSWDTIYQTTQTISDIVFDEVNTGYAILNPGMIIKTTDGGNNWDTIFNMTDKILNKIDVVNEEIVFACGNNGVVLRTINGGTVWTQDTFPSTVNLNQIIMFDIENGYATCHNIVYRLKSPNPPDTNTVKKVVMWPNPTNGKLNMKALSMINSIEIVDLGGKVVYTEAIQEKDIIFKYFPNVQGFYFVRVKFENGDTAVEKILFIR